MRIFAVPFRWLPRTFFKNISSCIYDIYRGVRNVYRWTPVIWFDIDFDWEPLAEIMEYKLRRMSKCLNNGWSVGCGKSARETLICAELLKRLREDEIDWKRLKLHERKMRYYNEYFGKIIGKRLRWWWD
jgi:hypothetical protein